MMRKLLSVIAIAVLLAGLVDGSDFTKTGSVGAQFLKIAVGSRYQGLGEASAALVNDAYSLYWNPAGLASIEGNAVTFTNVNWVSDVALNYVAIANQVGDYGVLGFSATLLTMGDMEITTVDQPEGTGESFGSSSFALTAGFGRNLTTRLAFGISIKYIYEKIYNESSGGVAFDFGTQLHTGLRSLRIGMNIANMGPELKFSGPDLIHSLNQEGGAVSNGAISVDGYELPLTFRLGAAYDLITDLDNRWTLAAEAKHPNDNDQQLSVGSEYAYQQKYFLRGGYKLNYDEQGLTLGAGLRSRISEQTMLVLDYAWADFGRLESVHRFSIGFTF
ncbi:MAG: PorV/PorQ family protein [candidate division Zixibacteria bacterium]|nr:PorV/PorQ family protein [candidate division Zixibacteria bacterium]